MSEEHTMSEERTLTVRCPTCGAPAQVTVSWSDDPHAVVGEYNCPHHCEVDAETLRNVIGAQ